VELTRSRSTAAWVNVDRSRKTRLRVFCIPYAGGGPHVFQPWTRAFSDGVEICPVHLPGRATRLHEPPFRRLGPLVDTLYDGIASALDTPFMLLGHSMGALIAFELARALRRRQAPRPEHLIVCACHAPQLPLTQPILHSLPDDEFIGALRTLQGTPEAMLQHPDAMKMIGPGLRADLEVFETYRYEPAAPLDCPIQAFGGLADARATAGEIDAWRAQTTASFAAQHLPGGHFFLQQSGGLFVRLLSSLAYEALRARTPSHSR
jgi:medium-chain acyl-[acyl-carrier-protein] hydrolase